MFARTISGLDIEVPFVALTREEVALNRDVVAVGLESRSPLVVSDLIIEESRAARARELREFTRAFGSIALALPAKEADSRGVRVIETGTGHWNTGPDTQALVMNESLLNNITNNRFIVDLIKNNDQKQYLLSDTM